MRVGTRTTLAMLVAAAIPLALVGWNAIRLSKQSLAARTSELHATNARLVADRIADGVRGQLRAVQLAAAALQFEKLSEKETLWGLRLIFRQISWGTVVVLLNQDGSQAVPPVYLGKASADPALSDRPLLTDADVDQFAANVPFGSALDIGSAIGTPYVATDGTTRLAVAVRTPQRTVLAVEIHLSALSSLMRDHLGNASGLAFVVDSGGFVILAADQGAAQKRANRSGLSLVSKTLKEGSSLGSFTHPSLGNSLGAGARVPEIGWAVIVAEPADRALAATQTLARQTLVWLLLGLGLALVLGLVFSRALLRPINALSNAASKLQAGDLGHRVGAVVDRKDELGDLGRAFDQMATKIQGWNQELEEEVESKTQELKESQELLARAQKLAAVGQLGAGVAHEINNPLTSMIANLQLIQLDLDEESEQYRCLQQVEDGAKRIQTTVLNLLKLADSQQEVTRSKMSIGRLVEEEIADFKGRLEAASIEFSVEIAEQVPPVVGNSSEFREALGCVLDNAILAMPDGGALAVSVGVRDDQLVTVKVRDNGTGIAVAMRPRVFEPFFSTRTSAGAKGMGLTKVHQIMEAQNGRVTIASEPGQGTTVSLLFPAVQPRSIA